MADNSNQNEGGSHKLRWIILIAIALGLVTAGRKWALSKSDQEFEERLRLADERRD